MNEFQYFYDDIEELIELYEENENTAEKTIELIKQAMEEFKQEGNKND